MSKNNNFRFKNKFWADEKDKELDNFYYKLGDGISNLMETVVKDNRSHLSNQELTELQKSILNKNVFRVAN